MEAREVYRQELLGDVAFYAVAMRSEQPETAASRVNRHRTYLELHLLKKLSGIPEDQATAEAADLLELLSMAAAATDHATTRALLAKLERAFPVREYPPRRELMELVDLPGASDGSRWH